MKKDARIFALLLTAVLCLASGCASGSRAAETGQDRTGETALPTESAAAQTDAPASGGEPEDWEEEWPEEYPVENFSVSEGAIEQTGSLNKYRYLQLDGAEAYMDLAADYVREALSCGDALTMREDSPHDGYANWFMEAPTGSASVSGSSVTGRFCFTLYPGFDRVLEMTEAAITDRDAMEQAAWTFAGRFSAVTGDLELLQAVEEAQDYRDERSGELKDVTVPAIVYTFRSGTVSEIPLEMQEGFRAPVACGDSTIDDPNVHCFTVTVWPDGTVVRANNDITRAQIAPNGAVRMLDEGDLPELVSYITSMSEHDTMVIERIRAESFGVYFGYADIVPVLKLEYHFESDPAEHLTTSFSMSLFED